MLGVRKVMKVCAWCKEVDGGVLGVRKMTGVCLV